MNRILLAAVLATAAISPGCRVFRRAEKPRPPVRVMQPPPEVKAEAQELPAPPELPMEVDIEEHGPVPGEQLPGPPRRRRVRAPQPSQPAEEAAAAVPVPEPPAPPPTVPQLTQILTPEQQAAYNASLDRNLDRARRTVTALAGRRLSRNQVTYLERIKSFIQQAGDARRTDLVRAANLAERASVLADDLLKSFN
jgi:hypothetical protein